MATISDIKITLHTDKGGIGVTFFASKSGDRRN